MGQINGQPVLILPEGALRTTGRDAQRNNIAAAKAVGDAIRTTLGPRGMDKMLVDSLGDVVISNDGATILGAMEIEHPAAKMMVEISKTQDEEVGDGTTTVVVLASTMLKKAEDLLDQEVHPTVITKGYRSAKEKALEILKSIAKSVSMKDETKLVQIAVTAMNSKAVGENQEKLAKIVVQAVKEISETTDNKVTIDVENVKLEKRQGGSISDTELIRGIAIDKDVVHPSMPKKLTDAKIALLDVALEVKELETDAEIRITSPEQMQSFLAEEEKMLKDMVEKIAVTGANVVFSQKGIDDAAQHYMAKKGIMAARRVKKSDMDKLARATGAKVTSNINDLSAGDLGYAGLVEEKKIAGEQMIFVQKCKDPKAVTILIRGGSEHIVDEVERAVNDAIKGVAATIEMGKYVAGGGAPEAEIARLLRKFAESFPGREQLAINAFADAMEIIPRTLAENAGLDTIDMLVKLRAEHDAGNVSAGVDVLAGKISDMEKLNVIDPLKTKIQAISSASEAAEMILRIDDVISASKLNKGGGMPPGGMPGMGEGEM
ncbi:MAG: thermosome subunit beta [Candidatus Aenigmatarchaeota archaeon]